MTAFIRRYRIAPTPDQLTAIEQIALVDGVPTTPVTGAGAGTMLLVGEFEDGAFNTPTEVFGEDDEAFKFGGLGYQYGTLRYQNPSARVHIGEPWNGNGFLKGKFLKPPRKIITRVDTSVGAVRFQPLASVRTSIGPFVLVAGQQLTVAPDGGAGVTTVAINATAATRVGIAQPGAGNNSLFVGGEQIGIIIDNNPEVIVTFQAADQTAAQVAARINGFLGYTAATTILAGTGTQIVGIILGTSSKVTLRDVSGTPLTNIGHTAGTTNGTGNVANVSAVTATEVAALINALVGIDAVVASNGSVIAFSPTVGTGSVNVTASAMATALGLTTGVTITALIGPAVTVAAGSRVRTVGGLEWVAMQSIVIPEGTTTTPNLAFYETPVRPGNDNGTVAGAVAGTVVVLVDVPANRMFSVTNIANLSAALDENTIDARYLTAFGATTDPAEVSAQANVSLSARRSDAVTALGLSNAILASDEGCFGRQFHSREAFGTSSATAISNVALNRGDRNFHTWPAWKVRIPEIAEIGAAGGFGFTPDGVILVGGDGPLAYINTALNPEENPGQDTGLLGFITGIEKPVGTFFNMALYTALKAAGICAPRIDQRGVRCYQSEATTSLEDGRTTQKRRKMADHLQDTFAIILLPFSKKLATEAREASIDARLNSFLRGYRSEDAPDSQRIKDFIITNTTNQNPDLAARGISSRKIQVQLLPSLDSFLVDTQIGEGQITVAVA